MSGINKMVKDLVEDAYRAKVEEKTAARFSVSVEREDNRRLEYVAKKLGMSKSNIVANLIKACLGEFETELSITATSEKLVEYLSWINSNDSVPDFGDDLVNLKITCTDYRGTREIHLEEGVSE